MRLALGLPGEDEDKNSETGRKIIVAHKKSGFLDTGGPVLY
jgi:hypothetical protein